jgi:hypothetical protein
MAPEHSAYPGFINRLLPTNRRYAVRAAWIVALAVGGWLLAGFVGALVALALVPLMLWKGAMMRPGPKKPPKP